MELRRDGAARQYDFIMEIQNGEKLFKSFSPVYAMESKKKKKKKEITEKLVTAFHVHKSFMGMVKKVGKNKKFRKKGKVRWAHFFRKIDWINNILGDKCGSASKHLLIYILYAME